MKLVLTGSSGFLATEVLHQALLHPSITSIVAIARTSITAPESTPAANAQKLRSVVVKDYGTYPDDVRKELQGADACIWTVAITPSKARSLPPDQVRQVCQEWTIAGFKALLEANPSPPKPLRFMYVSGSAAWDPARPHPKDGKVWVPKSMVEYSKMRGETATHLTDLALQTPHLADLCVAKPGFITGGQNQGFFRNLFGTALWASGAVETIDVREVAGAIVERVVSGFDGLEGRFLNEEMVGVGRGVVEL